MSDLGKTLPLWQSGSIGGLRSSATMGIQHQCGRCGAGWGGLRTAHCTACHETFVSGDAFDVHRQGSHVRGRFCVAPGSVGLVDVGRAYVCWGFAGVSDDE